MPNSAVEMLDKLAGDDPTPEDAFELFFSWYEDYWLMNDDLAGTLHTIPRPLREVVVTHQAFGYMCSEAPSGYYIRFESVFDHEVELGMVQLGFSESSKTLSDGRRMLEASDDGHLSLEQDTEICGKLPALEEVEDRVGRWLIKHANRD